MYDLQQDKAEPVVPRERRLCVAERMSATGEVLVEPDHGAVAALREPIRDGGARAVAICFLNAFVNPANEALVRDWLRQAVPGVPRRRLARGVPGDPRVRAHEHRGPERGGDAAGDPRISRTSLPGCGRCCPVPPFC